MTSRQEPMGPNKPEMGSIFLTAGADWAGEGQKQNIDDMLAAALQYYGERGELDSTPVPMTLERDKPERLLDSPLRYPGKLTADLAGGRLFIADSNNHRCRAHVHASCGCCEV